MDVWVQIQPDLLQLEGISSGMADNENSVFFADLRLNPVYMNIIIRKVKSRARPKSLAAKHVVPITIFKHQTSTFALTEQCRKYINLVICVQIDFCN